MKTKTLITRTIRILPIILSAFAMLSLWQPLLANTGPKLKSKPHIQVCFVLDTTGSMGGLIEGAKQKIWSIANEMISAQPTPELKLGLIGYRDRGDDYVVKSFSLTDDIDAIYGHLREFQAGGGGDTPESVNEALAEAIHKMPWSSDSKVLKIIFLVGDAPPHMDYPNGPKYPDLCREAAKKDLIINTIQCGEMAETKPIWQAIAKMSEGSYAGISQSGNVAVISTPMDKELSRLNDRIGATLIPYGDTKQQAEVHAKYAIAASAPVSAMADRLSYNSKTGKVVQGRGELVDALNDKTLKLDEIDQKQLPTELQKLDKSELQKRISKARDERADVQKQIVEVSKKREAYIQSENKRLAAEGKGDAFDQKVTETVHAQAAKKGISY
ncbi:MAG TPA: vWA domain-containing protein [Chthoniobacterales bacterium]